MGTDKVIFVAEQWGATGSDVTGSYVTESRVPGSDVGDRKWSCADSYKYDPWSTTQHIWKQQTLYVIMKIKGADNQGKE
jgi:hypothetical protein